MSEALDEPAGRARLSQRAVRRHPSRGALGRARGPVHSRPTLLPTARSPLTPRGSRITDHASRITPHAFTLIEIMVVIAILGIVMTMSIPTIYQLSKKEDMRKAVADILEVCSNARARAILSGHPTVLRIRPLERRFDVLGGAATSAKPADGAVAIEAEPQPRPRSGLSAQISDRLEFEMVDVNFVEYKEADEARVRFFSNGTCDEMTLVLRSQKNEYRKISLEITTSLATVDTIGNR